MPEGHNRIMDAKDSNSGAQCWYCGENTALRSYSVEVSWIEGVHRGSNRFSQISEVFVVPRCKECKDIHTKARTAKTLGIIACLLGASATPLCGMVFGYARYVFSGATDPIFFTPTFVLTTVVLYAGPFAAIKIVEQKYVISKGVKLHRTWSEYPEVSEHLHYSMLPGILGASNVKASL